jgi:hypothetical protein
MSTIQDLEQDFLRCWEITQDLDLLVEEFENNDEIGNRVLGLKNVYDMRFNKAWAVYEKLVVEHYKLKIEKSSKEPHKPEREAWFYEN